MSTLATWSHVVQSCDVSPHNFDGLAMSGLAFSVAPNIGHWSCCIISKQMLKAVERHTVITPQNPKFL